MVLARGLSKDHSKKLKKEFSFSHDEWGRQMSATYSLVSGQTSPAQVGADNLRLMNKVVLGEIQNNRHSADGLFYFLNVLIPSPPSDSVRVPRPPHLLRG